ncbi:MAG: metalloregulator ArsR/SmtB family transcription factor [Anaerolineae bacterium]|nr:metalloregulator ArsR/SmtB family transcription factor [Candidatus Roseilinea sp.]MDW8451631.1 metalloregulator ArsR/SmtB family transcription factor [Anaerolineae bacterium]
MRAADHESVAELFRALSHPERVCILEMLSEGERCVCDLALALNQRQAYVSQQLAVLRDAGLVACRRDGWRMRYRLIRPQVLNIIAEAQAIAEQTDVNAERAYWSHLIATSVGLVAAGNPLTS